MNIRCLILALVLNLGFVGAANSQDNTQAPEREALESIAPGLKAFVKQMASKCVDGEKLMKDERENRR